MGWVHKVHRGWRSKLSSLCCWQSPAGGALVVPTRREGDPSEGWIHRSTALGVCTVQVSLVTGIGSLWDFGWGMGEGYGASQRLCFPPSRALSSRTQQLSLLVPSRSPRSPREQLLTFNIPDVSHWLSELTQSGPSAFASQTRGSALQGGLPLHYPSSLPPVRGACTASQPFLLSSVGLSSTLGSRQSVLLVFWQLFGLFRQMWVESKRSAGGGEPSVLLHRHLPVENSVYFYSNLYYFLPFAGFGFYLFFFF